MEARHRVGRVQYWLLKSEPSGWSFASQRAKAPQSEEWSGVRNAQARNFMAQMQLGDLAFFYHTESERAIVGIVQVTATAHADSTADDPKWVCVDVCAHQALMRPVTLAQLKADGRFADMPLLRQPRLSVQPVSQMDWDWICAMGGLPQ